MECAVLAVIDAILEHVERLVAAISAWWASLKRNLLRGWMRVTTRKRSRRGGGTIDSCRVDAATRDDDHQHEERW
jgi:hypothetical protein